MKYMIISVDKLGRGLNGVGSCGSSRREGIDGGGVPVVMGSKSPRHERLVHVDDIRGPLS